MHHPKLALAMFAVVLGAGSIVPASSRDGRPETPSESEFVEEWFLVRLSDPIEGRGATDAFPLVTPSSVLNTAIEAHQIRSIRSALPVSTRAPLSTRALARHGLDRIYRFHVPQGSDIPALVRQFSDLPGVEWAEPDYIVRPGAVIPDDPLFPDQWGLHQSSDADVDAPEAWEITTGGGTIVAVIDTGVDLDHEDMQGKWTKGWDFVDGDPVPEDVAGGAYSGHGTNVSSIIAGNSDNGIGVAGLCWDCRIMPLRVWNQDGGGGTNSVIADAVVWATDHGARLINFSGGGPNSSQTELDAVAYAADAGVVHVAAAMNDGIPAVDYPGRLAETIAVGATAPGDWRWVNSNHGAEIDLVAPGVSILSADLDDVYLYWSGTSYSTPFVTGAAATMLSVNPALGKEESRHLLHSGGDDEVGSSAEDVPGFDIYHGWGRLNVHRSLAAAESSTSLRLQGDSATRVSLETANPVAHAYDFIRGDLEALSESTTGVELGAVVCLEDDSSDADTAGGNEDLATPSPGETFFYLARFDSDAGTGGYGGSSRNRDRAVTPWKWSALGDGQGARFGFGVASAGDVNGDGYDDAVIGAYLRDNPETNEGAAFVYHGSPAGLEESPSWSAEGDQAGAFFGVFVASAGDVNGDGFDDVIVGASRYDNGQTDEGRAYVYLGSASGLEPAPHWTAEGDQSGAAFGFRVGGAGDVDGDGYDDVIVAARLHDNGQTDEGRAYVYRGSASGVLTAADWVFEPNQSFAEVTAVSSAGDVNNDGYDDVVVGSRKYDGGEVDEGRVYLFFGSDSGLASTPTSSREINVANAELGFAVAAAGDVNNDGFDDVVASAHMYSNGEDSEGAAFVFKGSPFGLAAVPLWSFESNQSHAHLGQSVSAAGDLNGDAFDDIVVGGGDHDRARTDEGRIWVFLGSASGPSASPIWSEDGRQQQAYFGWSAATAGDVNGDGSGDLIVGAYRFDQGQTDVGRAFVYHGPVASPPGGDCTSVDP